MNDTTNIREKIVTKEQLVSSIEELAIKVGAPQDAYHEVRFATGAILNALGIDIDASVDNTKWSVTEVRWDYIPSKT